jgi:hypothetical protein
MTDPNDPVTRWEPAHPPIRPRAFVIGLLATWFASLGIVNLLRHDVVGVVLIAVAVVLWVLSRQLNRRREEQP